MVKCLDLPVMTKAASLDELKFNRREAIELHLEGEVLDTMALEAVPDTEAEDAVPEASGWS